MTHEDDKSHIGKLEDALLEYIVRYGLTAAALHAFRHVHAKQALAQGGVGSL